MFGNFIIYPRKLDGDSAEYTGLYQQLDSLTLRLEAVKNNLSIDSYGNVKSSLGAIETAMRQESASLRNMQSTLNQSIGICTMAEKGITTGKVAHKRKDAKSETVKMPTEEEAKNWPKDIMLSYLEEFLDSGGCLTAAAEPWLKIFLSNVTGQEIDADTVAKIIKTAGLNNFEFFTSVAENGWEIAARDAIGISPYFPKGTCRVGEGFASYLKKAVLQEADDYVNMSSLAKGTKAVSKWAGVAVTGVANAFENYEEYKDGGISVLRAFRETAIETSVDVVLGAGATVLASAGLAAVGFVGAPALAVGAVAAFAVVGINKLFEWRTGKDLGENVADVVCDAGDVLDKTACKVGNAIASWFR